MYTIYAEQLHHYISMCWHNEIANLELLQDNDLSLWAFKNQLLKLTVFSWIIKYLH
jgi:hypothetical protein